VIPSWAIHAVTVAIFFVGFGFGWSWRGWRDRTLAADLFRRGPEKADRERR
jgi:hypothetical protein